MLNYNIKGTEVAVTDELRTYVEKKLAAAEKFLQDSSAHADVELEYSEKRDGEKNRAEFTLQARGGVFRAEEWSESLHGAVDGAIEEPIKELRRSKKKRLFDIRRGASRVKDFIRGFRDRA